ncbi:MAG TPA: FKBP-type peptidyl-prolyl cis-trans isomerase [Bdellovibrionales bacterium]|nr:FKBP-type peptidyl-prolyl cis-trans isomerase [Bdellovibrionales bacterium]
MTKSKIYRLAPALGLILIVGCTKSCGGGGGSTQPVAFPACAASTESATELKLNDIQTGTGAEAEAGKKVKVHYTGTFMDCNKFDSSVDRGQPFEFQLGSGQVIPGWDEGVKGMKVGGKRVLIIPPEKAYGPGGIPGAIPPNATLRFEVELLGVE